jgi:IS66 C-terminal element
MAVGRRNWTFAGRPACRCYYPLIATAKLNNIDSQAWLADLLARLLDHPAKRIHELYCLGIGSLRPSLTPPKRSQPAAKTTQPGAVAGCVPFGVVISS